MSTAPDRIARFARLVRTGQVERAEGRLHVGVDLGTANIVMAVVDDTGSPVAGAWRHSTVVRDGIVVDWQGAVAAVRSLRADLSAALGQPLAQASVAVPPGISAGTIKVFTNVLEAAGMAPVEVVDEPVAAARVLGISNGAVIDVGHGTTGVSVLRNSEVVVSEDEATGGHHMTLVIAGSLDISYDEAERLKQSPDQRDLVLGLIRPTLEKMALIARGIFDRTPQAASLDTIHLVGGSSSHPQAAQVFAEVLGRHVVRPDEPLFVTPLGIPAVPAPTHRSEEDDDDRS